MSVRTTADEHLDRAREALVAAIKELAELVVNQCSGWDEFNNAYKEHLTGTLNKLITIRDGLVPD